MQTTAILARRTIDGIATFAMRLDEPPPRLRLGRAAGNQPWRIAVFALAATAVGAITVALAMRGADAHGVVAAAPVLAPDPAPAVPVTAGWIEINRPIPLFEIDRSPFSRLPLTYRARRREGSNERQDFLTYGRFGDGQPFLGFSVLRKAQASKPADFFVDMARLGAEQTLAVARSALPTLLPTRFGDFAIADVTLTRGTRPLACLGFRLEAGSGPPTPVEIGGFACGTSNHGMDRALLGCVLDRVDLLSAGDDDALREVFVAAERRRGQQCTASRLLSAGSRTMWLDAEATPPTLRSDRSPKPHVVKK